MTCDNFVCDFQDVAAYCCAHEQHCTVNHPRSHLDALGHLGVSSESLVINNAGNCCQGWSAEGKRGRKAHGSMHPLSVWLCQRKELGLRGEEDIFFQECTPLFDVEGCLKQPLASSHHVTHVITGPTALGWPACRDRQLAAGLSLETLVWVGPQEPEEVQAHFNSIFERRCVLSGSVFFNTPEEDEQKWAIEVLNKKGFYGPLPPKGDKLFRKLLTPGQFQRMEKYKGMQADRAALDGTFICDLDHWPNSPGPQCGPYFPTLLRHGTIIDLNTGRIASSSDRFLSLGFHVGKVSDRFAWPLADCVLLNHSDRVSKSFSGNCQALPAILAWQLYVFCHTMKREQPEPERDLMLGLGDLFEDAESEDEQ